MYYVTNRTDYTIILKSFDGDSCSIHGKARGVPVADKFDWHVPAGVFLKKGEDDQQDPTTIVKSRAVVPSLTPPKDENDAQSRAAAYKARAQAQTQVGGATPSAIATAATAPSADSGTSANAISTALSSAPTKG
jgi:hypothetical protein